MKKILTSIFFTLQFSAYAQIGIGTNTPEPSAILDLVSTKKGILFPRMTSVERNAIVSPSTGLYVFDMTTLSLWYYNGSFWINSKSEAIEGDVKSGIQTLDHSGWVLLDGRALNLLTANQQAVAASLGLVGNLPNASGAFLVQNGGIMASVSGSNTITLTQANLPNVNFTGTAASAGAHVHTGSIGNAGTHSHNYNDYYYHDSGNDPDYSTASGDAVGQRLDAVRTTATAGDHTHTVTINTDGTHTHTVSVASGGTAAPINIMPKSLTVNMFIYLGN